MPDLDPLRLYLEEIDQYPLLTTEEKKDLATKIRIGQVAFAILKDSAEDETRAPTTRRKVSRERARQLEAQGIEKLRNFPRARQLAEDYIA